MKRLLILSVAAILTSSSLGCCCLQWFTRGADCCSTCGAPGGAYADPYLAPSVSSDTGTYSTMPGPGT